MDSQIVEVLNVTRPVAWLPWAVSYFFLIGLSYGSFMLTLPYFVFGRAEHEKLGRLALLGALVCGLTAPVALLADLHGPGRFLNFYLYFQPQSWMSWGAFFIPIYLGGLLLYAWLALRGFDVPSMYQAIGKQRGVEGNSGQLETTPDQVNGLLSGTQQGAVALSDLVLAARVLR